MRYTVPTEIEREVQYGMVRYLSGVLDVPVVDKGKAPAPSRVAVQNHLHLIQVTKSRKKHKEIKKF
jgi:hypothetical protein